MRLDKLSSIIWRSVVLVGCVLLSAVVIWPILFALSSSFSPGRSAAGLSTVPFASGFTVENFAYLFTQTLYPTWFLNSFIIAAATMLGTLVIATIAGYVFSRFNFTFKGSLLTSMIVLQIFPSFVGMIAIYVLLNRIGALDTLWGLVLVYLAGNLPYSIWLVKSYLDTIPVAVDEAARIDGASHLRIYATIIMPLAKPILIFLSVTTFAAPWMDFIFPKLVLRSAETQTIALGLISFVTDKNINFTVFSAGAILVSIPFMIFFLLTQKSLISSLSAGALKD
jgi:arabinogalactan oligomer / maltooligosaccharide transport system permease protein